MKKRRPSLPVGHSVGKLAPIKKALHADDRFELYDLQSTDADAVLLLLARGVTGDSAETRRLDAWWASQFPTALREARWLTSEESPPNSVAAVIKLQGKRLDESALIEADDATLRRTLYSLLDLVGRGVSATMYPDLQLPLLWQVSDESAMAALIPLDGIPAEPEQVRLAARAFYQIATGIDVAQIEGDFPPLRSWSKTAGAELARVVDRCLVSSESKNRITSLSMLDRELGRASAGSPSSPGEPDGNRPSLVSSSGHGLDKVAGMHDLKTLLYEQVVTPIRNPEKYKRFGLSIPNGILLYGPPGCGKTYIARQLAEELGQAFFEIIPSELASAFIHQTVVKIRELFDEAAAQAPSIIFIDEFEALVPARGGLSGHQQYKAEEVNEFLAHLNGSAEKKIFVIAATNQPEKIDAAVLRTGRLDKHIYVGPPDLEARIEMLALHLQGRPVATEVDLTLLALVLQGYSASDLRFLVDEAARDALKVGQEITNASFTSALTRTHASVTPEVEAESRSIEQRGF